MGRFDSGAPGLLGLDYTPNDFGETVIDAAAKPVGITLKMLAAGSNLLNIGVHVGTLAQRGGLYAVEAYAAGDASIPNPTTSVAVPNEDLSGGGSSAGQWATQSGAITTIFTAIDESALNTADYIKAGGFSSSSTSVNVGITIPGIGTIYIPVIIGGVQAGAIVPYRFRFNTGSFVSLAGERIIGVQLVIWASGGGLFSAGLTMGGIDYPAWVNAPLGGGRLYSHLFEVNPSTQLPWTIAEVQSLDTTNGGWLTVTGNSTSATIAMLNLPVLHVPETRVAIGQLDDTASGLTPDAWNTTAVLTPTGGVATKPAAGTPLTVLVRRINLIGSMGLTFLDNGIVRTNEWSSAPTLDTAGAVTSMGPTLSKLYGLLLTTTGPALSVDSQPYVEMIDAGLTSAAVMKQELSDHSSQTYARLAGRVKLSGGVTNPLLIKVKRVSDNVQLGGTFTLTVAQCNALAIDGPQTWRKLTGRLLAVATMVSGTQCYLEFSTAETGGNGHWRVLVLGDDGAGDAATFGGTTDAATFGGRQVTEDIPITLGASALDPVVPANFTATVMGQAVDPTVGGVDVVEFVRLAWTGTALGASFARLELARSIDGGTTWVPIGETLSESITSRDVVEAGRGVSIEYRIQSVNTEGAVSGWSAPAAATTEPTDCELVLCSDSDPSLTVAYDYDTNVPYDVGDRSQLIPLANEDYGTGDVATEKPPPKARWKLKVGVRDGNGYTPAGGGTGFAAFAPLMALYEAQGVTIPHVCVLDRHGREWRGQLRLPSGMTEQGDEDRYIVEIELANLTDVPFVAKTQLVPA